MVKRFVPPSTVLKRVKGPQVDVSPVEMIVLGWKYISEHATGTNPDDVYERGQSHQQAVSA